MLNFSQPWCKIATQWTSSRERNVKRLKEVNKILGDDYVPPPAIDEMMKELDILSKEV